LDVVLGHTVHPATVAVVVVVVGNSGRRRTNALAGPDNALIS
jgi:hypothetical protein